MKLNHLLICTSLFACFSAMAQTASSTENAHAATEPRTSVPMGKIHDMMIQRQAKRLEELKLSLKLKPEQDAAWATFASSVAPHPHENRRQHMADIAKLSTPERIDKMNALQAQHDIDRKTRGDATKAFYAQLSDDQKKHLTN